MKLKFTNSLLVAGLIASAAGCFTSCKDTDDDMFNKLEYQILSLTDAANTRIKALEDAIPVLEQADKDLQDAIDKLKKDLEDQIKGIENCKCNTAAMAALTETVDSLGDVISTLQGAQSTLNQRIDSINNVLQNLPPDLSEDVDSLWAHVTRLESAYSALESTVSDLSDRLEIAEGKITALENRMDNVEADIKNLYADIDNLYYDLDLVLTTVNETLVRVTNLEAQVNAINERLNDPETGLDKIWEVLNGATSDIEYIKERLKADSLLIDALQKNDAAQDKLIGELQERDEYLEQLINDLGEVVTAGYNELRVELINMNAYFEGLFEDLNERVNTLSENYADLLEKYNNLEFDVSTLQGDVAAHQEAIDELYINYSNLKAEVNQIANRVKNLEEHVTSLVVQEVTDPILGSISLPVDIRTMILFNYWGLNEYAEDTSVTLPEFESKTNNFGYGHGQGIDFVDPYIQSILNPELVSIDKNENYLGNDGNFGQVYFTANPTSVDLSKDYEVALVNSQGEASKVTLSNIRPSEKVITFGNSRATTLWVADATLATEDIMAVKISSESNLKQTVKNALQERSLKSLAEIGVVAYKAITNNSTLPALGLQTTYTPDGSTVLSQLNIGAGTIRPLSYGTLDGANYSDRLPAWPNLDNWVTRIQNKVNGYFDEYNSKLHFEFSTIEIGEFNVDKIEIDVTLDPDAPEGVIGQFTDPLTGAVVYVYGEDLIEVLEQIKDKLEEYSESVGTDINDMLADLQVQINDMVDSMSSEVNSTIAEVLGDMQQTINNAIERVANKISGYWDKMETIYNHIYNVFKNPNHYMQAYMFYHNPTTGNIGRLSNTKAAPTIFSGNGDAVTLLATTLNAELLTPAYKKYVAITNVWDADGNSAADQNADCVAALRAANSCTRMNEPFIGEFQTVPFCFQHGYTYEIFYQALDFHGFTSTQKYYVKVK